MCECRGDGINVAYCIYLCYLVRFWNFAKLFPWLLVFCLGNIYLVRLQFCLIFWGKICDYQHVIGPSHGGVHCSVRIVGGRKLD